MVAGWTGDACDIPDCPGGCEGNGFCNGTDRDIPVCDCKTVSIGYESSDTGVGMMGQMYLLVINTRI